MAATEHHPTAIPPADACATCGSAAVVRLRDHERRAPDIDIVATCASIAARVDDGSMRVLRSDVDVLDMPALLSSDLRYTIVAFLTCTTCHGTIFWGLSARGAPIYRRVDAGAERRWPWEPVPPRELWI